jgi:uncharacterized protein YndB with AHSA1/START domain
MSELIVRDGIDISAAPSRVWEVLTKPEYTRQYMFDCEAISDWSAGSPLVWQGATDGKVYVKGAIVNIAPDSLLQYTVFSPKAPDGYEDKPENYTTVTLELTSSDGRTHLAVTQGDFSRIAAGELRYQHTVGSWQSVLAKIKEIAEGGNATS